MVVAFVVGLGVRLLFLGSKSLWLDEARSILVANNLQRLWQGTIERYHPPLYYQFLHYWLSLGESEFMLRLSSALLGSLAIPLSYALAVRLGGRDIALTTAWLTALSPLLVWYSQELRSYSLLLVLGLLSALALVRLVERPHLLWWLLYIVAMCATLYTHYVALLLLPVQFGLIALLYLQERVTRQGVFLWLAAWPLVVLLYWPWLVSPTMSRFMELLSANNLYPIQLLASSLSISMTVATAAMALAMLLAFVTIVAAVLWMLRLGPTTLNHWSTLPAIRYGLLFLFFAITIVSVIPRLYSVKRFLVHLWPYGLLVVAWVFPWRLSNRLLLVLLLAASLVGSLINVLIVPKDQWRDLSVYLMTHGKPNDALWIVPGYQNAPLNYYFTHSSEDNIRSTSGRIFDFQSVDASLSDEELEALLEKDQRVWLIYHTVDSRRSDPQRRLEKWLTAHRQPSDQLHLYKIQATLYTPP
jgi:uncharacterized membrane protein